jgi:hypothetical protein
MNPAGGASRAAVVAYLATHPRAIGELRALQRLQVAAQGSLERFFTAWLADPHAGVRQEVG